MIKLKAIENTPEINTLTPINGQTAPPEGGGKDGKDGVTFIPMVSPEGVISWTNDGKLPNPSPVNIKGQDGQDGQDGARGEKGDPFTYEDFTAEQLVELKGEKGDKGDKGDPADLTDYVKKTDFATTDTGGVVKVYGSGAYGVMLRSDRATLQVAGADKGDLNNRISSTRPIVPTNLDYAVKVGITTNTETLTAEEQAAAQAWLGFDKNLIIADITNNIINPLEAIIDESGVLA